MQNDINELKQAIERLIDYHGREHGRDYINAHRWLKELLEIKEAQMQTRDGSEVDACEDCERKD